MTEVEIKIAEAIKELVKLLVPTATTHNDRYGIEQALNTLREALVKTVGSRIIKGSK